MFNNSIKNSFTSSFDSWTTDKTIVDTENEFQVDIGSAAFINIPKFLIVAHQTEARAGIANKENKNAISDTIDVRNYFVEKDGTKYPRDSVDADYAANDYFHQYRDPKL